MAHVFKRNGLGRRVAQFNPSQGAESLGAWVTAVMTLRRESNEMKLKDAIQLVHDTPPDKRSEFAYQIWQRRRAHGTDKYSEVPF